MKWQNIILSLLVMVSLVLSCVSAAQVKVIKGEKGDQGEQGIQGIQGIQGEQGVAGKDGKDGEKGDKGDKGDEGNKGEDGEDGLNGIDGKDGKDGITPHIGEDGLWYIGTTCTEIPAKAVYDPNIIWAILDPGDIVKFVFYPLYKDRDRENSVYGYYSTFEGNSVVVSVTCSASLYQQYFSHYQEGIPLSGNSFLVKGTVQWVHNTSCNSWYCQIYATKIIE